jgi:hypothetical protein
MEADGSSARYIIRRYIALSSKRQLRAIKMVQVPKGAQDFELFGGFKPWHRQGEHSKIQKPKRF